MLNHQKASIDYESLFIEHYERLLGWALQLTNYDQGQAKDVVHDAFIQFTYGRPDLRAIDNLDAYLYGMLRNIQISQFRRSYQGRIRQLSIIEYDSAAIGLRVLDLHGRIQARDQLRRICRYACTRKETSKVGSVLILRFFQGYYPSEIARILRSSRQAVDERLRIARSEAKLYLEDPNRLAFMKENPGAAAEVACSESSANDLLSELRLTIFQSRRGDCLSKEQLKTIYQVADPAPLGCQTLGHLVSCRACLGEVNRLLGLAPLSERYPTDMLGPDAPPKGRNGSGSSRSHDLKTPITLLRRRAQEVFEHRPQELQISVNGECVVSQKIGAEMNELTLSLGAHEQIDFIDAFSEQGIRLLMLNVELTPAGAGRQSALIELSEGRTVEMILRLSRQGPSLRAIYFDPFMKAEPAPEPGMAEAGMDDQGWRSDQAGLVAADAKTNAPPPFEPIQRGWRAWQGRQFWRRFDPRFWLRPAGVTAIVSLVLIAALLITRLWTPAVSAAELLSRSTVSEEALAARADMVQHRIIDFEESLARSGEVINRRKVEMWRSAAQGIKARRIYDEKGRLIAGEWMKSDGSRTIYRRGSGQRQFPATSDSSMRELLETGDLWLLDLSAKEFAAIVGHTATAVVEEQADLYRIDYSNWLLVGDGLLKATLKLSRLDLHPIEQRLLLTRGGEVREYRFVEKVFERHPSKTVASTVFQPEPELIGETKSTGNGTQHIKAHFDADRSLQDLQAETVASEELEVEIAYLLNQIKADLGEQVNLTRTAEGRLRVEALVETAARKQEVLRALARFNNHPAIKIEVETVAEALKRQKSSPGATILREVEVMKGMIPADPDLRRYFTQQPAHGQPIDEQINQFANRMINRSRQALLHASALTRLVKRFSPETVQGLKPEAQVQYRAMINGHAEECRREIMRLYHELQPIFFPAETLEGRAGEKERTGDADPARIAEQLLQLSYTHDEMMRSAFTLSTVVRSGPPIKSLQVRRSLKAAESLVMEIQSLYQ